MNARKILALVLTLAMLLTLLAACAAKSDDPAQTAGTETETAAPAETETPAEAEDKAETDPPAEEVEEPESLVFEEGQIVDLNMYFFDLRMTGADHGERIEEAINAYVGPTYGLNLDITYLTIGDWLSKVQMSISGGERVDVMPMLFGNALTNLMASNMLTDITDIAPEYAPDALEVMDEYMSSFYVDGRLYGIPTLKNWVGNGYIIMRKDILEELDMVEKAENLTTWSELEEILAAVYEKYSGTSLYPTSKSASRSILSSNGTLMHGDNFADYEIWDTLGDSASVIYTDDDGNVGLYHEQPALKDEFLRMKIWADNGWVWPDSALTDTHGDELMKQGASFCTMQGSEIGIEVTKSSSIGYELVCTKYYTGMISSGSVVAWGVGVPITAEEPEAAMHFINALYTDSTLMNLLIWGEEGTDYELVDGQVKAVEGSHYYESDFIIGDNTLLTPLYGNGADHYQRVKEDIAAAKRSSYVGFALDKTDLDLAVSQLTAVNDQYFATLACGGYTDELYEEYLTKLEAAGVRDYIAEVQRQLDGWLAAQ